jgi:hypothetical protein
MGLKFWELEKKMWTGINLTGTIHGRIFMIREKFQLKMSQNVVE